MRSATIRLPSRYSARPKSSQLLHDGVDGRSALVRKQEQPESNDLAAIEQVTLSTEFYAKCLNPRPVLGLERKRRVRR